jgi:uncharacterized membrane protein YphA (DoxX/SURF4 family)
VKNFLFILIIIWFILGASSADDRGYFDSGHDRSCSFVGTALLTVVAGPLNYAGLDPKAAC